MEEELGGLQRLVEAVRDEAAGLWVLREALVVRQRAVNEGVLHTLTADGLLADDGHHLRNVKGRTLRARLGHDKGGVHWGQVVDSRRTACITHLRENTVELRLERLRDRHTRQRLELSAVRHRNEVRAFLERRGEHLLCRLLQILRRRHIAEAEREAIVHQVARSELRDTRHTLGRVGAAGGGVEARKETVLGAAAEQLLVEPTADHPTIVERDKALVPAVMAPLARVELGGRLEVERRSHRMERLNQNVEELLAGPQLGGLQQRGVGHLKAVAAEPVRDALREGGAVEEHVAGGEQISSGEEILCAGNNRLAILRCDNVLRSKHERQRLSARLFALHQMNVHLVTVEIGIVGRAAALVEAEGAVGEDAGAVAHHRNAMERRLAVKKDQIAIDQMALDYIADG